MKNLLRSFLVLSGAVLAHLMGVESAQAAILTASYENQLEIWLGEGNQDFTSIFVKSAGSTAADFHLAADGQGRTFSLMTVQDYDSGNEYVVGGYNPQSWGSYPGFSIGNYNVTEADSERTAFIYNLTTTTLQRQRLSSDPQGSEGKYQTFNYENYGPTFGGGHDLHVDFSLSTGSAGNYSYIFEDTDWFTQSIVGETFQDAYTVLDLEVYTFSPAVPATVPEPASLVIWSLGALGCAVAGYRRRRRVA